MKLRVHRLQLLRRTVQWLVLLIVILIPAVARYNNYLLARELDANIEKWEGTVQGRTLSGIDGVFRSLPEGEKDRDGTLVRNRERVSEYASQVGGGVWSFRLGALSLTDPLAGLEVIFTSRSAPKVLLFSLLIPVLAGLFLGRIFCSWVCPMGLLFEMTDKLRSLLRFLELKPRDIRFSRWVKYTLLAAGLAAASIASWPVLGTIYPPAVFGREVHGAVFALFDRAELSGPGFVLAGLTWMAWLLVGLALFEVLVSRRWWCRFICPGGAVYSLLGRYRVIRVRRLRSACTDCGTCVSVCPMALNPMREKMGMECDNCGVCVSNCPDGALDYGFGLADGRDGRGRGERRTTSRRFLSNAAVIALVLLGTGSPAMAHHILGIPHYSYDERYPQTPILEYRVDAGPHEIKMTGYPGRPVPGERSSLSVYITRLDDGSPFDGDVTLTAFSRSLFGQLREIYGPITAELDQSVYKFYPTFENEGDYLVRIEFEAADEPWKIDLPMVAGDPGSPWLVIGLWLAGAALFVVVIRAIRIKLGRAAGLTEEIA